MLQIPVEVVSLCLEYVRPWGWKLSSARLVCKRWQQAVVCCAEDEMREHIDPCGRWKPFNETTTLARFFLLSLSADSLSSTCGTVTESLENLSASIREIDMSGWTAAGDRECQQVAKGERFVALSTFRPPSRITDKGLGSLGNLRSISTAPATTH